MDASPGSLVYLRGRKDTLTERLALCHLALQAAIWKPYQKALKMDASPGMEGKVRRLQQDVCQLLGDSFEISWATVDQIRLLHSQGKLRANVKVFQALCSKYISCRNCPSPWKQLTYYKWLDQESNILSTERFLLKHFMEATEDPDFVLIPAQVLRTFLASPRLRLEREADAVRAILRWLQHDISERLSEAVDMLEFIEEQRMTIEEVLEIDTVFRRHLLLPIAIIEVFQERCRRFEKWIHKLGIHIYLAFSANERVEISELNVQERVWRCRVRRKMQAFQPEALTGTSHKLFVFGTEDIAIVHREGEESVQVIHLNNEFLCPMAYRFVSGKLYAVHNQGWRLQIWTLEQGIWTCIAVRTTSSWMYRIQLFANQEYLVIAGQRDKKAKFVLEESGTRITANLFEAKEPFCWTYHLIQKQFLVAPKFPGPGKEVLNLGASCDAFFVAELPSGKIWTAKFKERCWKATGGYFPDSHCMLCSTCCGSNLLVLSCNTLRGVYLSVTMLCSSPNQVIHMGSVPLDFSTSAAEDLFSVGRFHMLTDFMPWF